MEKPKCEKCGAEFENKNHGFFDAEPKPENIRCEHCQWADWAVSKGYCTQNNGDCETCSLLNYGRDCHNNMITHHAKIN